jgi:hypothetical protein
VKDGSPGRVLEVRYDDSDGVGLASPETSGDHVLVVSELVGDLADVRSGGGVDQLSFGGVEGARRRGIVDAGSPRDIFQGHRGRPLQISNIRGRCIPSSRREKRLEAEPCAVDSLSTLRGLDRAPLRPRVWSQITHAEALVELGVTL